MMIVIAEEGEGSTIGEDGEIPLSSLRYTWTVLGMLNQFMDETAAIQEVWLAAYTLAIAEDHAHTITIMILVTIKCPTPLQIIILLEEEEAMEEAIITIIITEAGRQEIREMLAGMNWGIQSKLPWKAPFEICPVK